MAGHISIHTRGVCAKNAPVQRRDLIQPPDRCRPVVELRHLHVVLEPGLAEVLRLLAARPYQAPRDLDGVVFGLRISERKRRCFLRLREDVRDSVGVAADDSLLRQRIG